MANTLSKTILTSLTTAAIAIPGIAHAEQSQNHDLKNSTVQNKYLSNLNSGVPKTQAAETSSNNWFTGVTNDLKFTRYKEDGPRYAINVWQALLVVPVKDFQFELDFQRDSESGASVGTIKPQATEDRLAPNPTKLVESRTGATIQEDRNEITFRTYYNMADSKYGVSLFYSVEDDTKVPAISVNGEWRFNKNNTRLQASAGVAKTITKPTRNGVVGQSNNLPTIGRYGGSSVSQEYYVALLQDLSKYNYIQVSTQLQYTHGFLDDHYRAVYFNGDARALSEPGLTSYIPAAGTPFPAIFLDGITASRTKKPSSRAVILPLVRFVQYVPMTDGAVHLDYRFAADTWDMKAHMLELAYYQPFFEGWTIAPKIRYYTQSRAKFYGPTFNVAPNPPAFQSVPMKGKHYTSDYRLSGYGTLNYEVKLNYKTESRLGFGLTAGYYKRQSGYKLGSKDPIVHNETRGSGVGARYVSAELNFKL